MARQDLSLALSWADYAAALSPSAKTKGLVKMIRKEIKLKYKREATKRLPQATKPLGRGYNPK
jgi:hypothetical protein